MSVPTKTLLELYRTTALIRAVEEKIAELYPAQEMRCPTHLSIGQEGVAAGVCAALRRTDSVFLNHRCHAAYIAKGGSIPRMVAELYGKKTGCTRGRGGSMHLVDPAAGLIGTSSILAGTVPIACGAALAYQRRRTGQVAVCFFGDAAVEEGTFFESVNIASLWRLPVVFVCENNGLSTCTPITKRQAPGSIRGRVASFGVDSVELDGNNAEAVYEAALRAVRKARTGGGPAFLECRTYRWLEHVGPNFDWDLGYRSKEEVESWMRRCPLKRLERRLEAAGGLGGARKARIAADISRRVEAAVRFARRSQFPRPEELQEDLNDQ